MSKRKLSPPSSVTEATPGPASSAVKPKAPYGDLCEMATAGGVVVKVGPQHTQFYVHKVALQEHSDYFRNALKDGWKEAEEGVITLEDVEPNIFRIFFNWLYTG